MDFSKIKSIHFIGIGGIGVSALARMFFGGEKKVSGSDQAGGEVVASLKKLGIKVSIGHKAGNLPKDCDLVIYTIAISADNPELVLAREKNIPCLTYPEALGAISASKYTIAVSGTHGKTTTTAMLGQALQVAGLEPTIVVGSFIKDKKGEKTNYIGGGEPARARALGERDGYFVTEACEYRRSFLNLSPQAVIITNIDADHLDYYKDIADIQSAFASLVKKIPASGYLVCSVGDPLLAPVIKAAKCKVLDYSKTKLGDLKLKVPGVHNLENAKATATLAKALKAPQEAILKALEAFRGTWRRFELVGKSKLGATVYSDYGHHPAEVRATIAGARELYPKKKIVVAFQPHLYSRTRQLLPEFATSLEMADQVYLAPIYAAREKDDGTVSSRDVADAINNLANVEKATFCPDFKTIKKELLKFGRDSVIIVMGAGDIYEVAEKLVE